MTAPGPRNLITDVGGIQVGNAHDQDLRSGVTVILPDSPAVAAVDTRGGGPGTRETDALAPDASVEHVHAIVLSGGSAFGLDAASGAMGWLAKKGRGFTVAGHTVPIVPAAILFDLNNGGDKASIGAAYESRSPYAELASTAIAGTAVDFDLGNVGAGFGATAGPLKGGLGSASLVFDDGPVVGALAAVNSHGSPVIPGTKLFWSWALEQDDELGGQRPELAAGQVAVDYHFARASGRENTSLAVVATDAALSRVQARRVAIMAQDGIARAVRPAHTPLDGDTVFVLATGEGPTIATDDYAALAQLGTAAADCVARAVARGVYEAASVWGLASYKSL